MSVVEAIATAVLIISAMAFVFYLIGLIQLPTGERPKTATLNRFGEEVGMMENPGFEETEEEEHGE